MVPQSNKCDGSTYLLHPETDACGVKNKPTPKTSASKIWLNPGIKRKKLRNKGKKLITK